MDEKKKDKIIQMSEMLSRFERVKCHVGWIVVEAYLDGMEAIASELFDDPEYKERFDSLRKYINYQIYGDEKTDVADVEVVVYREKE